MRKNSSTPKIAKARKLKKMGRSFSISVKNNPLNKMMKKY